MRTGFQKFINSFSKKNESYCCSYADSMLFFDYENNVGFCPIHNELAVIKDFDGIWLDIDKIKNEKRKLILDIKNESFNEFCLGCEFLKKEPIKNHSEFDCVHIGHWKYCYINCKYCNSPKQENLIEAKHYDILPSIKQLIDSKLISKKTKIVFDCGDATVHPEFDKLMYFFINYEMTNVVVNTAALRYCESISEAISKNIASVVVSFDSGCSYVYGLVKSLNKFDIALSNVKRYLSFQEPNQKRVILKYTLVKGLNDNQKEILDWFIFARDLGVKKLEFDIDSDFYLEVKTSVPFYLKEIILFVKNISEYNNIEIEFCPRVNILYNLISENP